MVGGLVQQQQFGVGDQRTRQRDALLRPPDKVSTARSASSASAAGSPPPGCEAPGIVDFELMRQPLKLFKRVHIALATRCATA